MVVEEGPVLSSERLIQVSPFHRVGREGCDEATDQYFTLLLCSVGHVMLSPSKLPRMCLRLLLLLFPLLLPLIILFLVWLPSHFQGYPKYFLLYLYFIPLPTHILFLKLFFPCCLPLFIGTYFLLNLLLLAALLSIIMP